LKQKWKKWKRVGAGRERRPQKRRYEGKKKVQEMGGEAGKGGVHQGLFLGTNFFHKKVPLY